MQRFATNPTAASIVRWLFTMRLQEMSLAGITTALNNTAKHQYQLKGLLCGTQCGRRLEGHRTNAVASYQCRHDHTSATDSSVPRPRNTYLREDRVLAKPALLHHMLTAAAPAAVVTSAPASATQPIPPSPEELTDHLHTHALVLRYDPRTRTLKTSSEHPVPITSDRNDTSDSRDDAIGKEEPAAHDLPSCHDCRQGTHSLGGERRHDQRPGSREKKLGCQIGQPKGSPIWSNCASAYDHRQIRNT
ncbi:hypothetical protein [Catenulispora rubra]|uniref:hypothetical protein n=1 Tax=Catenulispora rubra TaxID=280293 RepID=UPI0018922FB5|nr:hypothetical protein [Catenulispora rubra]